MVIIVWSCCLRRLYRKQGLRMQWMTCERACCPAESGGRWYDKHIPCTVIMPSHVQAQAYNTGQHVPQRTSRYLAQTSTTWQLSTDITSTVKVKYYRIYTTNMKLRQIFSFVTRLKTLKSSHFLTLHPQILKSCMKPLGQILYFHYKYRFFHLFNGLITFLTNELDNFFGSFYKT